MISSVYTYIVVFAMGQSGVGAGGEKAAVVLSRSFLLSNTKRSVRSEVRIAG
jgi:hypothetical protein